MSYKLHAAINVPKRDVLIVSPTQRQSDEMLQRVAGVYRGMAEAPKLRRDNASEMGLSNGSRVISLPGSEGGIRGSANVRLLVLDEAARIDDDVFASVLPMVGSDGQILALSTPWGRRGWFYNLHEDDRSGWEWHKVVNESGTRLSGSRRFARRSARSRSPRTTCASSEIPTANCSAARPCARRSHRSNR